MSSKGSISTTMINSHKMIVIFLNVRSIQNSARFVVMYNMIIKFNINVLIIQKFEIFEKRINYYIKKYSKIEIATNYIVNQKKISIILNFKIIIWNKNDDENFYIIRRISNKFFLIYSIKYKKNIVTIISIYVLTKNEKQLF